MATAKKLPSGSWRCLAYSHTEKVLDEKTGKPKKKRIYESFTSDDPSPRGKKEAELAAAQFAIEKEQSLQSGRLMTLEQAIQKYISSSDAVLSASTLRGYNIIRNHAFRSIMDMKLKDLSREILQQAVNEESKIIVNNRTKKLISSKTVKNRYGLITAVINRYHPTLCCTVRLPAQENKIKTLPQPEEIMRVFVGDHLELAVLLAMWLSFTMSEIRGLTKSKSLDGDYIVIREVLVNLGNADVRKPQAKTFSRNRMHHIPPYIKHLIDEVEGDIIVPYSAHAIYKHFTRKIKSAGLPHISFHELRHLNASVMAMLQIPEKYALERGGWKTDKVMKQVYTHTFSQERIKVDGIIDTYFENMQHEMQHEKENPLI